MQLPNGEQKGKSYTVGKIYHAQCKKFAFAWNYETFRRAIGKGVKTSIDSDRTARFAGVQRPRQRVESSVVHLPHSNLPETAQLAR